MACVSVPAAESARGGRSLKHEVPILLESTFFIRSKGARAEVVGRRIGVPLGLRPGAPKPHLSRPRRSVECDRGQVVAVSSTARRQQAQSHSDRKGREADTPRTHGSTISVHRHLSAELSPRAFQVTLAAWACRCDCRSSTLRPLSFWQWRLAFRCRRLRLSRRTNKPLWISVSTSGTSRLATASVPSRPSRCSTTRGMPG